MREKIKKILMEEQYSSHMIKALLAGIRKPNPEIRYKLRHIVPFEVWGRDIRGWLKEQKENKDKK